MRPATVLLIGMMGAGKTTMGREIAARTGWPYRDNDELVREIAGVDAPTLLDRDGEEALRRAESAALRRAVEHGGPLVASVAGGVVDRPDDLDVLRRTDAVVVYLCTPLELLVERVGDGAGRPFLQPDPAAALERLLEGRDPRYREVADVVVDTSTGSAAEQAERLLARLPR